MVIDRLERQREYGELRYEKPIIDYFRSDRFFVGCEGNESALSYVIDRIGPKAACLRRTLARNRDGRRIA